MASPWAKLKPTYMNERIPRAESKEIPKTVLDYLREKHNTIINDYRTPDGRYVEHCGLIAIDIAQLFLSAGKKPYIAEVSEDVHEGGFIHSKELAPIIYEGRVTWGAHQVCCCDGQAFDPILDGPVPVEEYAKIIFGEDIKMSVLIPYEQIEEFINR